MFKWKGDFTVCIAALYRAPSAQQKHQRTTTWQYSRTFTASLPSFSVSSIAFLLAQPQVTSYSVPPSVWSLVGSICIASFLLFGVCFRVPKDGPMSRWSRKRYLPLQSHRWRTWYLHSCLCLLWQSTFILSVFWSTNNLMFFLIFFSSLRSLRRHVPSTSVVCLNGRTLVSYRSSSPSSRRCMAEI